MPDESGTPGAPPMQAPPSPAVPPGPTGPATIAPRMDGVRMQAQIKATQALKMLEQAAMMYGGSQSPEGQEILSAVVKLAKKFGSVSPDVGRADLKSMGEGVSPVSAPSPMQGQNLAQAIQAKQRSQGLPAAAA